MSASTAADRSSVVIVPRETFVQSKRSLASVLEHTPHPERIVVVDGGSPKAVRDMYRRAAQDTGLTLVRTESFLSPNEARNLGLKYAAGDYVVFVDNDLMVEPGWLEGLEACADETGAWVVGPIYLIGSRSREIVHMAGGLNHVVEAEGRRHHIERHNFSDEKLAVVAPQVRRQETEVVEFHCMLVRREALHLLGPLDERLTLHEHCDLCLAVSQAGGTIWLEPTVVVSYEPPSREQLTRRDKQYWYLRWGGSWNATSFEHFRRRWEIDATDPDHPEFEGVLVFALHHRRMLFRSRPRPRPAGALAGARWASTAVPSAIGRRLTERFYGWQGQRRRPMGLPGGGTAATRSPAVYQPSS